MLRFTSRMNLMKSTILLIVGGGRGARFITKISKMINKNDHSNYFVRDCSFLVIDNNTTSIGFLKKNPKIKKSIRPTDPFYFHLCYRNHTYIYFLLSFAFFLTGIRNSFKYACILFVMVLLVNFNI